MTPEDIKHLEETLEKVRQKLYLIKNIEQFLDGVDLIRKTDFRITYSQGVFDEDITLSLSGEILQDFILVIEKYQDNIVEEIENLKAQM